MNEILNNWMAGKKREFQGEVYLTKGERNRAYQAYLKEKAKNKED